MAVIAPVMLGRDDCDEGRYDALKEADELASRPAPWAGADGQVVGARHFGPLCLPNPYKSATVRLVAAKVESKDVEAAEPAVDRHSEAMEVAESAILVDPAAVDVLTSVPAIVQPIDAAASTCVLL